MIGCQMNPKWVSLWCFCSFCWTEGLWRFWPMKVTSSPPSMRIISKLFVNEDTSAQDKNCLGCTRMISYKLITLLVWMFYISFSSFVYNRMELETSVCSSSVISCMWSLVHRLIYFFLFQFFFRVSLVSGLVGVLQTVILVYKESSFRCTWCSLCLLFI